MQMASMARMIAIFTGSGVSTVIGKTPETAAGGGRDEQEGQHRAEHEHVAMGEVDELDDAVDEGVAEGDEREDEAVREADDRASG